MQPSNPTRILMEEHRIIETVLDAIEERLSSLGEEKAFPKSFFAKAVDFIVNFADGSHHAKEEHRLFPALVERGMPKQGGPIGCMLKEHDQGRRYVAGIKANLDAAETGDPTAIQAIRENAAGYIDLLRSHIEKEDQILFRMADSVLRPEDICRLESEFEYVETHEIGAEVRQKYEALAGELAMAASGRTV